MSWLNMKIFIKAVILDYCTEITNVKITIIRIRYNRSFSLFGNTHILVARWFSTSCSLARTQNLFFNSMENLSLISGIFNLHVYDVIVFSWTLCSFSLSLMTSRLWSLPTSTPLMTLTSFIDFLNFPLIATWSIGFLCCFMMSMSVDGCLSEGT